MCDYFIPLGGGNEVGASAYFLSIDGVRILLDCGARLRGEELFPDYERLLQEIPDFSDIDMILISHGHYDHIGSFARIATLAPNAEIITTQDTKRLISMQLLDFGRISGRKESEKVKRERYRQAQPLMSRIRIKPVMRSFDVKGCRITFLPAGHMMGAVMIYIESKNHKVLYSGDFSLRTAFGLNGIQVMDNIRPDVLLLNAPNTYLDKENWTRQLEATAGPEVDDDHYLRLEEHMKRKLEEGKKIYLMSRSIPRHLDLFYFLENAFPDVPVYLEPKSRVVADGLSEMGYCIYRGMISTSEKISDESCIIVGQETGRPGCSPVTFDSYSLHASPGETMVFMNRIHPSQAFLLHVYPDTRKESLIDVMREEVPDMEVVQAVNGKKYYIKRENEMLHKDIYDEVMKKQLAKAQEELRDVEKSRQKSTVEWAAIYGSFLYPEEHPKIAYRNIQKSFVGRYRISFDDYLEALKNINLDISEKRKYVLSLVEEGVTYLKKALDGDQTALEKYVEFTEDLEQRDRKTKKTFFVGKCLVAFMILLDPDLQDEAYRPIVVSFGARYCDRLLRNIRDALCKIHGVSRRKPTARDLLKKTEKALSESSAATAGFDSMSELEQLRFMNNNYKNSLELVQAMLDELNETIDESAAEAKNTAIASFYSTMNSEDYGNLLDSIQVVDRRLAALKEQKVKIPPQILPLTIVFKQLLRFIKDCGITPIDTVGREFETEVEGLADYTYIGEAYTQPGEKKIVVVERAGWRFESTIISLPTVREKED